MPYQNLTPRTENITVSSGNFTGTTGTTGRTHTFTNSDAIAASVHVLLQGIPLTHTTDFTVSGQIVTFNVVVDDGQTCVFQYLTGTYSSSGSGNAYTTAALVEAEIRASAVFSSSTTPTLTQVNTWIEEESASMDSRFGMTFASTSESSSYFDYGGEGLFRFPYSPLISVDEVRYNIYSKGLTPSWVTLQEGFDKDYITYLAEAEVEFIDGEESINPWTILGGAKRLCISYTWGDSSVPPEVQKLATLLVAKRVIGTLISSQANTEGGSIQVGTIRVSDPSNYSVNYLKSMNAEIDRQYEMIGHTGLKTFRYTRVYD